MRSSINLRACQVDISRRAFFRGRRSATVQPFRPPWAIEEELFLAACTRCEECLRACPTGLLIRGDGGFPQADLYPGHAPEGCTFCGACATACQPKALQRQAGQPAWAQLAVIGEDCLAAQDVVCRTCGERCEAGAIRFPPRLGGIARPQLSVEACTGCAACLADCPTHAIRIQKSLSRGAA